MWPYVGAMKKVKSTVQSGGENDGPAGLFASNGSL